MLLRGLKLVCELRHTWNLSCHVVPMHDYYLNWLNLSDVNLFCIQCIINIIIVTYSLNVPWEPLWDVSHYGIPVCLGICAIMAFIAGQILYWAIFVMASTHICDSGIVCPCVLSGVLRNYEDMIQWSLLKAAHANFSWSLLDCCHFLSSCWLFLLIPVPTLHGASGNGRHQLLSLHLRLSGEAPGILEGRNMRMLPCGSHSCLMLLKLDSSPLDSHLLGAVA